MSISRSVKRIPQSQTTVEAIYAVFEDRHFRGRCNQYGRPQLLSNLDDYLSESDWKRLMASPLAAIARLGSRVQFSAQLVHYVLQRQLRTRKEHEAWYMIHGKIARFSIVEFALVTGLKCSFVVLPEEAEGDKAACLDFFGVEKVKMEDFEVRFQVAMKAEPSYAKRFKYALLMLVEGVLFGKEPCNYIQGWVVNMVANVNAFLSYPWGRLCYERTHEFLKNDVERKLQHGINGPRPSYLLAGFPLAFQLWVYEAVTPVANQFAVITDYDAHPRCLRYASKEHNITYDSVVLRLQEEMGSFNWVDSVLTVLIPDAHEAKKRAVWGVVYPREKTDRFFDDLARAFVKAAQQKATAESGAQATTQPSWSATQEEGRGISVGDISLIMAKIDEMEREIMAEFVEQIKSIEASIDELKRAATGKKPTEFEDAYSLGRDGSQNDRPLHREVPAKEVDEAAKDKDQQQGTGTGVKEQVVEMGNGDMKGKEDVGTDKSADEDAPTQKTAEENHFSGRMNYQENVIEPLSNVPFFRTILMQSHVKTPYNLALPVKMQAELPRRVLQVILTHHGKTWEMEYLGADQRKRFSTAWKHFVHGNNLRIGDACVFELMDHDNNTARFKVQILRGDFPEELQDKVDRAGESLDNPIVI